MANFPTPGSTNFLTGFINGFNNAQCPQECRLMQNSPIYNKNDYATHNNIYNMEDINGYYCAINSGPPIPHTQHPEGYTTQYFYLSSNNWSTGNASEYATEDEVYTNPRSDFLFNAFNTSPSCVNEFPPDVPAPPIDGGDCAQVQNSLTWFRLDPNLFK